MTKRYANLALIYAVIAMVFGIFYREFTKFYQFSGKTNLSVLHAHYFALGMLFFLLLMVLEKSFAFSADAHVGTYLVLYQVGLNITGLGFVLRGLTQVWGTALSRGMDASISGIAGIGHILLSVALILLLLKIKKRAA